MKKILIILLFISTIYSVLSLPIQVIPLDGSGDIQPSTSFNYQFNFTTSSDCSGVVLSNISTITTDKYGRGFIDLNISSISEIPSYLCEYRDGSLRKVHILSDQLFKDIYANSLNLTNNVTASYFIGNGGLLNTNSSNFWDNLDTINATQMEDSSGLLNIKESWFTILWDAIFGTKTTDDLNQGSINFYDNQSWNETKVIQSFVPYIGATTDVNIGSQGFIGNYMLMGNPIDDYTLYDGYRIIFHNELGEVDDRFTLRMNETNHNLELIKDSGNGLFHIQGNLSVNDLIKLNVMTLPICNSITNGSIGRNETGVYCCSHDSTWVQIF